MGTQWQPLTAWLVWQHSGSVLVSSTTRNTRNHHLASQGLSISHGMSVPQADCAALAHSRKENQEGFLAGKVGLEPSCVKRGRFLFSWGETCMGEVQLSDIPSQTLLGVNICGSTHGQQQLTQVAVCVFTCPRHPSSFSLVLSKSPHLICWWMAFCFSSLLHGTREQGGLSYGCC